MRSIVAPARTSLAVTECANALAKLLASSVSEYFWRFSSRPPGRFHRPSSKNQHGCVSVNGESPNLVQDRIAEQRLGAIRGDGRINIAQDMPPIEVDKIRTPLCLSSLPLATLTRKCPSPSGSRRQLATGTFLRSRSAPSPVVNSG